MPTLVFFTPLLLSACHNVNRFVASCTVVIYRVLYHVDDAEIVDATTAATY